MRHRLTPLLLAFCLLLAWASPAAATDENGNDQQASGGVQHGDPFVEVVDADSGQVVSVRGGGDIVCRYYDDASGDPVDLGALPPELNGLHVQVLRMCDDVSTGEYVSVDLIVVVPPLPPPVDPAELARMARSRLPIAAPEWQTYPDAEQVVNVPSWLWVDGWAPLTRTATAGGVTATVTAMPVSQRWDFGNGDSRTCQGAGSSFDRSRRVADQPPPTCSYAFPKSSASSPGETFAGSVTVTWQVSWSSNIGAGGNLGLLSRSSQVPFRVAEVQAVNQ
jgi:hypothetical protein